MDGLSLLQDGYELFMIRPARDRFLIHGRSRQRSTNGQRAVRVLLALYLRSIPLGGVAKLNDVAR